MPIDRGRAGRAVAATLLSVALALLATAPAAGAKTVHIRGTAYEFNNTGVRLGGATIRVAQRPRLHATVGRDGTYDLAVPDRATVTPYIVAAGHHTIFLQTFRTAGVDLDRVNFQTPTEDTYRALAALLAVPLGAGGELRACAIVSTFSTRNVRDVSFRQFTAYGAPVLPEQPRSQPRSCPRRSTSTTTSYRTRPSSALRSTAEWSGPASLPACTGFARDIPLRASRASSRRAGRAAL